MQASFRTQTIRDSFIDEVDLEGTRARRNHERSLLEAKKQLHEAIVLGEGVVEASLRLSELQQLSVPDIAGRDLL